MEMDEIHGKYEALRDELETAYGAAVWNSDRIDRLTEEMAQVEMALASSRRSTAPNATLR